MKKVLTILLAVCLVFALVACGGNETAGGDDDAPYTLSKNIYSIGGGTAGSAFVTYTTALGDLFTKNVPGMKVTVEPGSSSGNQIAIHNGEQDFGILSSLQVVAGTEGTDWANGKIYDNVCGFIPGYSYEAIFVSMGNSGIKSFSDLDGKVVAIGAAGSGSDTTGRQLFDFFDNVNPKNLVNGSWTDLGGQLQDGMIDCIFYLAGHPASFITELEVQTDLNIFALTDEEMNKFVGEYEYYVAGDLSKDLYKSMDSDLKVLQGWNFIGVSPDLDDDLVYHLTKTVWENVDVIHNASASFKQTSLENVKTMNLRVHPGAAKYYEEVGAELPSYICN